MEKPKWVVDKERAKRAANAETVWLFGLHAVRDALSNPARQKLRLVVTQNALDRLGAIPEGIEPEITDARTFDPYTAAAGYAGPTLLLHGTEDFVPLRYAERYVEVLDRAELEVIPGADHGWMTVPHRDLVERRTLEHFQAHARHGSEDHA